MTDIALDEKALEAAKDVMRSRSGVLIMGAAFDVIMKAAIRAYLSASPSQVAPANPAQVTDAMVEVACIEFLRPSPYNVDWSVQTEGYKNVRRSHMRAALTAAIGAGGQAVAEADQVFDAVLSCPHSIDAQSVVLKAAYDKPGNALKQLHDRITAALSQPHPADERVAYPLSVIEAAIRTKRIFDDGCDRGSVEDFELLERHDLMDRGVCSDAFGQDSLEVGEDMWTFNAAGESLCAALSAKEGR